MSKTVYFFNECDVHYHPKAIPEEMVFPDNEVLKNHKKCTILASDQNGESLNRFQIRYSEKVSQFNYQKKVLKEKYGMKVKVIHQCEFENMM